jgi:hypothetical protein
MELAYCWAVAHDAHLLLGQTSMPRILFCCCRMADWPAGRAVADIMQGGIATAVQHHGKEMSYNNYLDADAAYSCCCDFKVS